MTYASREETLGLRYPMPSAALAPLAWYLGVHMLKCLQEAGKTTTTTSGHTTVPIPTEDKTTQIDIYSRKTKEKDTTQDKRAPTKTGRRQDKVDDSKKHRVRRSESDASKTKKTVENRESKSIVKQRSKDDMELTKQRSEDQPSGRRNSCSYPKRTPEAPTETIVTEWLMNPVYTSENGDRTDRSEMSLPWQDIGKAKSERDFETTTPRLAVKSFADNAKRHIPAKIRSTQPTMEPVHEAPRNLNLRPQPGTRMPTPTDLFVQEVVKRKLGKAWADMDTASLKSISRERVKQLAEKYANKGDRPGNQPTQHVPASLLAQQALRAKDSADSMYVRVDPQRGRVVV